RAHRLGEDRVGAGVDERLGAVDGGTEPLDGADVGPGHDEEVRVPAGVDGGPDTAQRRRLVDQLLAVEVAAALGVDLVLDVEAGHPGVLEHLDGAGDVHRLAEAGVGIDDGGQLGHAGDLSAAGGDLAQRGEPDVRLAEVRGEDGAGDVDAVEAL